MAQRKEVYWPTWRGWFCLAAVLAGLLISGLLFFRSHIVSFLAVTQRVPSSVLVVEGWIPDYNFTQVKREFETGQYQLLIVTGNPLLKGDILVDYRDYPNLTRASLLQRGWNPEKVEAVSSGVVLRDRTYSAARALRSWLLNHRSVRSINVMSFSVHARRTWLLYQIALRDVAQVGIVAGRDSSFDPEVWWRSSQGVRSTLDETIAYCYCRFFFRPTADSP